MNKFTWLVGLSTIAIFGIGGIWLIEDVQNRPFEQVLLEGWSIPLQLLTGLVAGLASGGLALFVITRPFFKKQKKYYYDLIASRIDLNVGVILFLSLCAGIGEEIFFRAGMQPLLGLWLTSVIFVALHGYLSISNWQIGMYGLIMLGIIAGFGYLYRYTGLFTVMTAHSAFDFVLFMHIYRSRRNYAQSLPEEEIHSTNDYTDSGYESNSTDSY